MERSQRLSPSLSRPARDERPRRESSARDWLKFALLGVIVVAIGGGNPFRFLLLVLAIWAVITLARLLGRIGRGVGATVNRAHGVVGGRRARPVHFVGSDAESVSCLGPALPERDPREIAAQAIGTRDPLVREPIQPGLEVMVCMGRRGRCGAVLPATLRDDLVSEFENRCPSCGHRGAFEFTRVPEPEAETSPPEPPPLPAPPAWRAAEAWKEPVEGRPRPHPSVRRRLVFRELAP